MHRIEFELELTLIFAFNGQFFFMSFLFNNMNVPVRNCAEPCVYTSVRYKLHFVTRDVQVSTQVFLQARKFLSDSKEHLHDFISIVKQTGALRQVCFVSLAYSYSFRFLYFLFLYKVEVILLVLEYFLMSFLTSLIEIGHNIFTFFQSWPWVSVVNASCRDFLLIGLCSDFRWNFSFLCPRINWEKIKCVWLVRRYCSLSSIHCW